MNEEPREEESGPYNIDTEVENREWIRHIPPPNRGKGTDGDDRDHN